MAISADTVYQRVLALANKEQRGYITPQEFNLLANQAQISIFESYFYSKNLKERKDGDQELETDETDILELLSKKLNPFMSIEPVSGGHTFPQTVAAGGEQCDVFQTGRVFYDNKVAQRLSINEIQRFVRSVRHISTTGGVRPFPIYSDNMTNNRDIVLYANSTTPISSMVSVECFRVPTQVNWAYVVVNDKALYNANVAVDFELHKAEEDTLVNRILDLAGIVMNKPGLIQIANAKEAAEQQVQNI